jgi:hypothetical protein
VGGVVIVVVVLDAVVDVVDAVVDDAVVVDAAVVVVTGAFVVVVARVVVVVVVCFLPRAVRLAGARRLAEAVGIEIPRISPAASDTVSAVCRRRFIRHPRIGGYGRVEVDPVDPRRSKARPMTTTKLERPIPLERASRG